MAVVIASAMSGQARADKVGVTVQAAATVRDISSSKARLIVANTEIFENDRLKANSSGNAQIELVDGTKVVIGPNADVKIDDFVYSGGPTLKKLTLSATRGAFRFITGRSSHAAYAVNTPYGTIGVRGTAFDVSVSGGATHIALLNGGLRVCDRTGHCKEIKESLRIHRRRPPWLPNRQEAEPADAACAYKTALSAVGRSERTAPRLSPHRTLVFGDSRAGSTAVRDRGPRNCAADCPANQPAEHAAEHAAGNRPRQSGQRQGCWRRR